MLSLTDCVEAYEQSIADGSECALELFVPHESHPEYSEIVVELVRVEMEHRGWQQQSNVAQYCERFPNAFADAASRAIIAFEEFRVRRQHGEAITRQEYADRFLIDTTQWPSVASNPDIDHVTSAVGISHRRRRLIPPVVEMDEARLRQCIAEAFPEFEPVEELGRGAFGRVFLARQRDLADRLVVIKVTSDTTTEPERLARLQHTNIVPVYSVHRTADWQAICMPFFGRRTLRNFPPDSMQASLSLVQRVAEGLQHAHSNGILHRDVKPANILVTDDDQPMLLDFNLSSDVTTKSLTRSIVGGTVPYLAPEQLESLQSGQPVAATADLYSLGVILFEMLAGRLPFEPTPSATLSSLILKARDRSTENVPCLRDMAPNVTAAVQDIVFKCLQPRPEDRYQSAAELAEDLKCELNSLPLKYAGNTSLPERVSKWRRRHPRLLSVTSLVATLAVVTVVAGIRWIIVQDRIAVLHAQSQWQEFRESAPAVRTLLSAPDSSSQVLSEGLKAGESLATKYNISGSGNWQSESDVTRISTQHRQLLDEELSEIVFLMASAFQRQARLTADAGERQLMLSKALVWNEMGTRFESAGTSEHSWNIQRIGIQIALGLKKESDFKDIPLLSKDSGQLTGFSNAIQLLESGDATAAQDLLTNLVQQNPHDYSAWFLLGKSRQLIGRHWEADAAFSTCIALNSECWLAWQDRAVVRLALNRFQDAAADCSQLLHRRPDIAEGYLNRALAKISLNEYPSAEKDLELAIAKQGPTRAYFLRANVRQLQGNVLGAQSDYEAGLRITPNDCDSWVARGMAFLQHDPDRALADFRQAQQLNPVSRDAFQNSAHVLSERLNKPEEAIVYLDALLSLYPGDNAARIGRAVLNARAERDEAARSDAEMVLTQSPDPVTVYQVACVYALLSLRTASETESAMRHLASAMKTQPQLYSMAEQDSDLNPVRNHAAFHILLKACRSLLSPQTDVSKADVPAGDINVSHGE